MDDSAAPTLLPTTPTSSSIVMGQPDLERGVMGEISWLQFVEPVNDTTTTAVPSGGARVTG